MPFTPAYARNAALPGPVDTRHTLETPEGIELVLRPAGLVVRALAFVIDLAVRGALLAGMILILGGLGQVGLGLGALLLFLVNGWYMVLFEVLRQGRSPGKQLMGLCVIHDDATPIGWTASLIRNLLRLVDMLPMGYCVGAFCSLHQRHFKRLGDLAAGTLVIYRDPPSLSSPLHDAPSSLATRQQNSFEQRHRPHWQGFERLLERLEASRANAEESEGYSRRYRHLCSQLALARERGYSLRLIDTLERLAMAGHRQLYRHRSRVLTHLAAFVLAEFPRQVRQQWRWVAAAAMVFVVSLIVTLCLVYQFPDLLYALASPKEVLEMEAMYDPGAARFGPAAERLSSSGLMMFGYYVMHNIGIAFQIFAGGLLLGLGSLYLLVSNGLAIGAVAGHLSQIGFNQTFWPFVIGHGAFELTGLVLAGAAGLRLGAALIAPGRLTRVEAVRRSARQAMQLVYGAVALLLMAAFIEAYWSSITTVPISVKYGVGITLWLLVMSYLSLAGRRRHAPE